MCLEFDYVLSTDGGAATNGSAHSLGSGACCLQAYAGRKPMVRPHLGSATKSEAEYQTLIGALKHLLGRAQRASRVPSAYSSRICACFHPMVGQLTQSQMVKGANLCPFVDGATVLVYSFGRCDPSTLGTGSGKVLREEIMQVPRHSTKQVECQSDRVGVDTCTHPR